MAVAANWHFTIRDTSLNELTTEKFTDIKPISDELEIPCVPWDKVDHHHQRSRPACSYSKSQAQYSQPTTLVSKSNSPYSAYGSSRTKGGVLGGSLAAAVSKKEGYRYIILFVTFISLRVDDSNY